MSSDRREVSELEAAFFREVLKDARPLKHKSAARPSPRHAPRFSKIEPHPDPAPFPKAPVYADTRAPNIGGHRAAHLRKGRLAPGYDADLAVIDENDSWTVEAADMHNLNRYTPLEGKTLSGRVTATFVRGTRVFSLGRDGSGSFGPAGGGRRVKRESRVDV